MEVPNPEIGCVVIPAFREQGRIGTVVRGVRRHIARVVVVDDGSEDGTAAEAESAGAVVLRHGANRGKGVALQTGFAYAAEQKAAFVIALDADGQHDPDDIPAFLAAYRDTGAPVLIGNRMDRTGSMPLVRRLTNRFMSWLLSRRIGQTVPDTQCGFRLYRTDVLPLTRTEADRFAAESEVLLNIGARGLRIGWVPIRVIYGGEKSKIRPIRDTIRFFRMLRQHGRRQQGPVADRAGMGRKETG